MARIDLGDRAGENPYDFVPMARDARGFIAGSARGGH